MNKEMRDDELLSDGKRLTVCIPQDMYSELCKQAKAENMKVSVLVRIIFKGYIDKHRA